MTHNDHEATPSRRSGSVVINWRRAVRARKILAYLRSYHAEWGIAPTLREIGQACNIPTTSVVRYHLDELERQGLVKCHRHVSRGTILLPPPDDSGRDH